jgi:hypothetical protein
MTAISAKLPATGPAAPAVAQVGLQHGIELKAGGHDDDRRRLLRFAGDGGHRASGGAGLLVQRREASSMPIRHADAEGGAGGGERAGADLVAGDLAASSSCSEATSA